MKRNSNRLTYLEIRGFKSIPFQHPMQLHFGDINILLGANGAGKSNLISFFKMLGYMMNGQLQRFVAEAGTNQKFLYYGSKRTPELSATLTFGTNDLKDEYHFSLTAALPDRLIVSSEEIIKKCASTNYYLSTKLPSNYSESSLNRNTDSLTERLYALLKSCKVYQFSDSSTSSPMRLPSEVESAHYLQSDGGNLASFLYFLKNNYPASYDRITEYVREVVPQFRDFYLEPAGGYISLKWMDDSPNDYILSADQFSDGSIRFIALATLLLQPEETMPFVIIIDEPELGLHPYAIDQLNEMIKDASHHAQVIVATQSTAIIDGFSANDITVIERDKDIQGTVARRLNEQEYREWLDEYSLSELWNKNVIGGRPV